MQRPPRRFSAATGHEVFEMHRGAPPAAPQKPMSNHAQNPKPQQSRILYVEVPRTDIARFRFLLEAHGHLAIATVLDRFRAVLKLRCTRAAEAEVRALLSALGARLLLDPEEAPGCSPAALPHERRVLPAQSGHLPGGEDQ